MKYLIPVIVALVLVGCGRMIPIRTIDNVGIDVVRKASELPILSVDEASSYRPIGKVTGHSCKHEGFDAPASKQGAIDQARIAAVQLNAVGVVSLECKKGGISLIKNCWESWECSGTAVQ